ncbi:unnamed protein product [Paramecium sonneborni]|uniref:non-specific serine/threonine protein kinase n=1 Tax=Paramecium sonneborni TaxID=65129 RepID=A0A8S1RC74_9CILI|nr:unnamed protein product [Paramecium sonneborni]
MYLQYVVYQLKLISLRHSMTETKLKIAIRRYSSPYKNGNQDKNDISFNCVFRNINIMNPKRIIEQKAQLKNYSDTRKYSKDNSVEINSQLNKHNFQLQYVVGVGGFGRVWKVNYKQQIYAMKEISKALVLLKQSVHSILSELQFLTELRHNFLINVFSAFQDNQNLYLVLDYLGGGDLRFHLGKMRKFSEEQTKFFAACIIIGLEYLHDNNIIHRDIKPENLILDYQGYVHITDLGIAIKNTGLNFETSGTPGYMAPEVIFRQDHGIAVDYFALGVICYEFMTGRRPYYGNRREIREQILAKQVSIHSSNEGWSNESIDFINQLLQRKPKNRLMNPKQHKWFKNFPFESLIKKKLKAPFIPSNSDNFDKSQIIYEDEENNQIIKLHQHLTKEHQHLFQKYSYQDSSKQLANKSRKNSINNSKIFQFN